MVYGLKNRSILMKKTLLVLGLVFGLVLLAATPAAAGEKGSWKGWIADAKCA